MLGCSLYYSTLCAQVVLPAVDHAGDIDAEVTDEDDDASSQGLRTHCMHACMLAAAAAIRLVLECC